MTLQKEMIQRDVSPNSGGNFGSLRELYRVTDDAGINITIEDAVTAANWPASTYPFERNTDNVTDPNYYVIGTSLSQPASPKIVDIAVEYTNKVSFLGKTSATPQQADRNQPGYCSITTRFYPTFVDVWKRESVAAPIQSTSAGGDPYAVADIGGESRGAGNVDMAGQPVSLPILEADVSVSLTRDNTSDRLPWDQIRAKTGTRILRDGGYLGFATGTLVVTGARVTETFAETGSINYELSFKFSSIGHLRQIVGSMDANGFPVITADTSGNFHAADIFVIQPFTATSVSTNDLMSAEEYAKIDAGLVDDG